MSERAVLAFCEAREALKRAERESREERAVHAATVKAIAPMLLESMQTHDVTAVVSGERRVRCTPGARRSKTLTSEEDALALVEDVARHVEDVPLEKLPAAVAKLVHARALGPPGPPRVTLVKATAAPTAAAAVVPRSTQDLAAQYVHACADRTRDRQKLAPLRAAKRDAEKTLLPLLTQPVLVRVGQGPKAGTLRLEARAPSPAAATGQKLGIRTLLPLVRKATEEAARDRAHLDDRLRVILARELKVFRQSANESCVRSVRISCKSSTCAA